MSRAVLLVSHGTVNDLDDLAAFVTNVRRGHPPGADLVSELGRRYVAIGGSSPLNAINALLANKLERKLGVPVAWANRLWKPYVRDVLLELARRGATEVVLLPLAQHSAHVYAEDARRASEGTGVTLACAANWGRAPGLVTAFAGRILATLATLGDAALTTVVMTAHSLPKAVVSRGDPYEDEMRAAAGAVADAVTARVGSAVRLVVAFQSQGLGSGSDGKRIEWLGPDVMTILEEAKMRGDDHVVFAPIGFLADHIEILYDLDIEARAMAEARGFRYLRVPSLNADDDFVDLLADLAQSLLGIP